MKAGDEGGDFGRGRIGEEPSKGDVGGRFGLAVHQEEIASVDG